MDDAMIELNYYTTYECRFCGKTIQEKDLDKHRDECEG